MFDFEAICQTRVLPLPYTTMPSKKIGEAPTKSGKLTIEIPSNCYGNNTNGLTPMMHQRPCQPPLHAADWTPLGHYQQPGLPSAFPQHAQHPPFYHSWPDPPQPLFFPRPPQSFMPSNPIPPYSGSIWPSSAAAPVPYHYNDFVHGNGQNPATTTCPPSSDCNRDSTHPYANKTINAQKPLPELEVISAPPPPSSSAAAPPPEQKRAPKYLRKQCLWSAEEHKLFLEGLKKYGKGKWALIHREFLPGRSGTQIASHAQKHFLHHNSPPKAKKKSVFEEDLDNDIIDDDDDEVLEVVTEEDDEAEEDEEMSSQKSSSGSTRKRLRSK